MNDYVADLVAKMRERLLESQVDPVTVPDVNEGMVIEVPCYCGENGIEDETGWASCKNCGRLWTSYST